MTRKTLAPAAFYAIAVLVAVADQIAKAVVLRDQPS